MVETKDITIGIDESGILSVVGPRPQIGVVPFVLEDLRKLEMEGIKGKNHFGNRDNQEQQRIISTIRRDAFFQCTRKIRSYLKSILAMCRLLNMAKNTFDDESASVLIALVSAYK